jgi:hypothetical protein
MTRVLEKDCGNCKHHVQAAEMPVMCRTCLGGSYWPALAPGEKGLKPLVLPLWEAKVGRPPYPKGTVSGPCVCGSWPGGPCLECEWREGGIVLVNTPEDYKAWDKVVTAKGDSMKLDTGKLGLNLLPTKPLEEIAKVLDFGAKKYAPNKWREGMSWTRLIAATLRHLFAWSRGINKDTETGLSHLAHAGCCILFLLQYEVDHKAGDDRFKEAA